MRVRFPKTPPDLETIQEQVTPQLLVRLLGMTLSGGAELDPGYLHWDRVRHKQPPEGLTPEAHWLAIKMARGPLLRDLPLRDRGGRRFRVAAPEVVQRMLATIDRESAGTMTSSSGPSVENDLNRFMVQSFTEEAISSSQLEGASTTRAVARRMLEAGTRPRTNDELMIVNNYVAMQRVAEWRDEALTPEKVLELHRILMDGTSEGAGILGRLRTDADDVRVWDGYNQVLHTPPDASELESRMASMCRFANGEDLGFHLHDVSRAILLHLWLAYDHPFVDGNGRTARALFHWSMLRSGFWLMEYASISTAIKNRRSRYDLSFLHSETDDNDATYFLVNQLEFVLDAISRLKEYLTERQREASELAPLVERAGSLNSRQRDVVRKLLKQPRDPVSIAMHQRRHGVVYQTARADLLGLEQAGLVTRRKEGRAFQFAAAPDLESKLRGLAR